ncbi:hypothetical protein MFLO_15493 [Listeria floridensis FSL S10-1187]|uniref:HTH cro/C1-type domain-containing protein n=1 Tax=Listeria floridensis FSL S10-1187 TaxID=1265817 RepID=A0ABN0RBF1_9LIST|nr:hypothetical protein [Listeria floridensis]EUJ25394.1 hypothetical protein MFLO_15493 [Listeria floridensis FSL S10-1187]
METLNELQRMAENMTIYMSINGYTKRTFAKVTGISQNTMQAITSGKIKNEKKLSRYINVVTEKLQLEPDYFKQSREEISKAPIKYQDEEKLHTGNEKFNALSLMLKIGEIHYEWE